MLQDEPFLTSHGEEEAVARNLPVHKAGLLQWLSQRPGSFDNIIIGSPSHPVYFDLSVLQQLLACVLTEPDTTKVQLSLAGKLEGY